jgi:hypothetical protein
MIKRSPAPRVISRVATQHLTLGSVLKKLSPMRREGKDSEKRRVRSTHRRRRKLARLLLGDPTEHALDYPGFFVLPRAISQRDPASGKRPTRRARWGSLKLAMLGLFTLVGFVGLLAYFFAHVEPAPEPHPSDSQPYAFDPKHSLTNKNFDTDWHNAGSRRNR